LARETQLVITTVEPNSRREIRVITGVNENATTFADMVYRSTGLLSSTADNVVARIDEAGQMRGFRQQNTVQMSDTAAARIDTMALRVMKDHAVRHSSRKSLDATTKTKVRQLVDWMSKRCPT
jgi:hypothetical protein